MPNINSGLMSKPVNGWISAVNEMSSHIIKNYSTNMRPFLERGRGVILGGPKDIACLHDVE